MTDPHSIENTVPIPPYLALPSLSTRKPPASSEYSTVSTEVFPVQAQVYSHGHMSRTNPRPMTPPCTESDTLSAAQRESGTKIGQSMCKLPSKWRPQFYPQCPVYRADGCAVRNRTSKANKNRQSEQQQRREPTVSDSSCAHQTIYQLLKCFPWIRDDDRA